MNICWIHFPALHKVVKCSAKTATLALVGTKKLQNCVSHWGARKLCCSQSTNKCFSNWYCSVSYTSPKNHKHQVLGHSAVLAEAPMHSFPSSRSSHCSTYVSAYQLSLSVVHGHRSHICRMLHRLYFNFVVFNSQKVKEGEQLFLLGHTSHFWTEAGGTSSKTRESTNSPPFTIWLEA